jgi:hypothetical protein
MRKPRTIIRNRTDANGAERSAGRSARGTFTRGNQFARGRSPAHAELRAALLAATSTADVRSVWRRLIGLARKGNVHAIGIFLDRVFGRATQSVHAHLDVNDITPNYDRSLDRPDFI